MHRIRVPSVHPIVCCTFKRALRLLPSILLIAFVLSLIFVTLIQVAVIHSQRRAIYLQRRVNGVVSTASSSPLYAAQPSSSSYLSSPLSSSSSSSSSSSALSAALSAASASLLSSSASASSYANSNTNGPLVAAVNKASITSSNNNNALGGAGNVGGGGSGVVDQKFPAGSPASSGGSGGPPGPTSKPGEPALRVEAILDRNAPSVENFAASVNSNANAARIRRIFDAVKCHVSSNANTTATPVTNGAAATAPSGQAGDAGSSALAAGAPAAPESGASSLLSSTMIVSAPVQLSSQVDDACGSAANITLCPQVPSGLRGRVKVDFTDRTADSSWEGASALAAVAMGGCWEPVTCSARHRVAIIVPFRDRAEHLQLLLQHLHPILQRQMLSYKIFVIEQYGNDTFNKGVLLNAGAREALQDAKDYECLVFHDVDLIPEDDRNLYSCPTLPRHMSVAVDKFNYTLPYVQLVGGVFSVTVRDFVQLNGYSNLYWGWGGEDDDMAHRIKHKKLKIVRPPASVARYTMVRHAHRPESPNNIRMTFIRMASYRMNRDGLTTAKYTVVLRHVAPLYTKVIVDIGHNHKWHFANPQKLIVSL